MRICVVGHYSGRMDNRGDLGVKQLGLEIARRLGERHETLEVDIREPLCWKQVRAFQPQIIHFVLGPSMFGLLAARVLTLFCGSAKSVVSAPNPSVSLRRMGTFVRPDLVLIQSYESETMLSSMGCATIYLPNGVDVDRFVPAPAWRKMELRAKYGINSDRFVVLHVGPVIRQRNVQFLTQLQQEGQQTVLVGRTSPLDRELCRLLQDAGCMVFTDRLEHIEEIYALSDCYIFPTPPTNRAASIEMPLSVLEAMSCNLPVITTRFGALPRAFDEGQGLTFVDNEEDLVRAAQEAKSRSGVRTRDKVAPCSWENILQQLDDVYQGLIAWHSMNASRGTRPEA
jgi:glycosyltransferase involved in cell wall biosynthesis